MKHDPEDPGFQQFLRFFSKPRIITCPQAVVTYTISEEDDASSIINHLLHPADKEQRIREILAANPDADLTAYESALGIKIIKVDRKANRPSGDIYIGE